MPVNPLIVKTRVEKIEESVARLREIAAMPEPAFFEDPRILPATERLFQVAIQALLDIGSHIIAEKGFREAEWYAEIIDILGEEGVLPADFAKRIRGMAGLRNLLVHGYAEVDANALRKHLDRLADFEEFCRRVLDYLAQ